MQIDYFGDSYDVVKQSLLRWLRSFGGWSVHPMFTKAVSQADVAAFELMLDARVISTEVFTALSDRAAYLTCGGRCGHLFLRSGYRTALASDKGGKRAQVFIR